MWGLGLGYRIINIKILCGQVFENVVELNQVLNKLKSPYQLLFIKLPT